LFGIRIYLFILFINLFGVIMYMFCPLCSIVNAFQQRFCGLQECFVGFMQLFVALQGLFARLHEVVHAHQQLFIPQQRYFDSLQLLIRCIPGELSKFRKYLAGICHSFYRQGKQATHPMSLNAISDMRRLLNPGIRIVI